MVEVGVVKEGLLKKGGSVCRHPFWHTFIDHRYRTWLSDAKGAGHVRILSRFSRMVEA